MRADTRAGRAQRTAVKDLLTGSGSVGVVTVHRDGSWYVSPLRTSLGLSSTLLQGVPRNHWIVDLDGPVALDGFHLADGRWEPVPTGASGVVRLEQPVSIDLELDRLVP